MQLIQKNIVIQQLNELKLEPKVSAVNQDTMSRFFVFQAELERTLHEIDRSISKASALRFGFAAGL